MPVNHDHEKRWLELELVVPGSPEQVWQAIATGAGNQAWFTNAEIGEHVGGTLHFDFGGGASVGEVTDWDPPHRFGYVERDWSGEAPAPPLATEITVTARSGDRCTIRMVHSLYTDADTWDGEIGSFETGWPGHFAVLRSYLAHHPGRPATTFQVGAGAELPQAAAWKRMTRAFGLQGCDVGDELSVGTVHGVVEQVHQNEDQRYLVARLTGPDAGALLFGSCAPGGRTSVGVNVFLYGQDAPQRATATQPAWQQLLDDALG